jgi:CheY-like chemotaxis protein
MARILNCLVSSEERTRMQTISAQPAASVKRERDSQVVVIVNGNAEVIELIERVLEAGRYDVVFVESSEHAYSQIKRVQPNLVILCVRMEDLNSFQVLSMLKLDAETRDITVLTCTTEYEDQAVDEEEAEPAEPEIRAPSPALPMN